MALRARHDHAHPECDCVPPVAWPLVHPVGLLLRWSKTQRPCAPQASRSRSSVRRIGSKGCNGYQSVRHHRRITGECPEIRGDGLSPSHGSQETKECER
jgi:hypothetical protein